MQYVRELLAPELSMLEDAVFVPLGKSVLTVLEILEAEGRIPKDRAPYGFPHPSGANGHRARQFEEARFAMRTRLDQALRR
jgi:hypothetical protein